MKTYKFKLYKSKRNKKLHRQINIAGSIYNHCIALHRRYYKIFKKSLRAFSLSKHLTKLKKITRYSHWKLVGSQAIQDISERISRAYALFFAICNIILRLPLQVSKKSGNTNLSP